MIVLKIILLAASYTVLAIILLLLLLLVVNIGLRLRFDQEGQCVSLKFGFFYYNLTKREGARKTRGGAKERPRGEKAKRDISGFGELETFKPLIKSFFDFFGSFARHLKIRKLKLHVRIASDDAFNTAMNYGYTAALVGMLFPAGQSVFDVKCKEILIEPDFCSSKSQVYCSLDVSIKLLFIVLAAGKIGVQFLKISKNKKTKRSSAAI